ncbi:MAG: helix-turn-helix transcriptional regulator [Nitrososphaeraceae archaeon]
MSILLIFFSGTNFNKVHSQVQYQVNSIFIGILSNGDSIVQYDLRLKTNASEIPLPLMGGNINEILVRNYLSKYLVYSFNSSTNEIKINTQNESQVRVTYQTPDLVNKQEREWSFLIDSAFPFTVKLPNDAVVTNLGEQSPSLIRKLGGQNLLSFDKGKISIDYVIGYAGTREQAIISINSAELDLTKAASEHNGINLDEVKRIIQAAKIALNQSNFIDAERLANNASDISAVITESFETSKDMISNATAKIENVQGTNIVTAQASEFISKSNIEFSQGNYPKALEYATLAINSLDNTKQEILSLKTSTFAFILLIPIAATLGIYMLKKYRRKNNNSQLKSSATIRETQLNSDSSPDTFSENRFIEQESSTKEHKNNNNSIQSDLHKLIADIITQKRNLKPEEKEILFYLSDNEGAAFEGEIRNRFILPKTSLWRLIKRLEREDMIEVIKTGGQNLIKLKFPKS